MKSLDVALRRTRPLTFRRVSVPVRLQTRYLSATSCAIASGQSIGANSTIFSGIQPTGIPHLGNYLGALEQWVQLQRSEARLLFSIVDLHAITVAQDAARLRQWRQEALAVLLAIGLEPQRCTLFFQSDVSSHTELMWVLSCTSSVGFLSRMTTWKSKAGIPNGESNLDAATKSRAKLGLFAYPVLQAADILVHGATLVPVGADQVQHLEFARECARNFNATHGQSVLREPHVLLSKAARVMSLRDPGQKMSKSDPNPRSTILVTDTTETIHAKVKASLTDSLDGITFDPSHRPGIANLLCLLSYLSDAKLTPEEHAVQLASHSLRALKALVADEISLKVKPIREAYLELTASSTGRRYLQHVADDGAGKARENARGTMEKVYTAVGLR